ncbi:MAG: DUF4272 domain-containing protein [Peptococcaceae bacterium]|nr:DUF4272 domain-containing protein [Peptococcaceae bacterium]
MVSENVFLLCWEDDIEDLMGGFCRYFGVDASGAGSTLRLKNGTVEMNIGIVTQKTDEKFIREQKEAVWKHFHSVHTKEPTLKLNVLHQISFARSFVAVTYSYETTEDQKMVMTSLRDIFKPLSAVLLAENGSVLLNTDFQVVFDERGQTQVSSFVPYERSDAEGFLDRATPQQLARRDKSFNRLRERDIYSLEYLPVIESAEECTLRPLEEMSGRAACLLAVALYAEHMTKGSAQSGQNLVQSVKQRFGCDRYLSPKERQFLESPSMEKKDIVDFSWQYENLLVLEWVLGIVDELAFPEGLCDVQRVLSVMNQFQSLEDLMRKAQARSLDEVLDEADFIYRLDWTCVDAQINSLDAPKGVEPGVVMERHKTLNWLITKENWDEVDIST